MRAVPRLAVIALLCAALSGGAAHAFCGFYVGKADAQLFNDASQVAMVRDGDRTVLTMSNDYRGPLAEFALVVPVPTVLSREQIHVGDRRLIERLDAYSAPRLVEYFDPDPCGRRAVTEEMTVTGSRVRKVDAAAPRANALGVSVEARYTVGEYDILLLSARESGGLQTWLTENGYRVPPRAAAALQPYVRQDMKFFVAKVNLKEQAATGMKFLRPLQIAYESKKFMLPIRLGMANAQGPQDLVVYALTRRGRVESVNYRTTRVPSDVTVPEFVKSDFGRFYKDAFSRTVDRENRRALLTEYVWDMGWCDPCAAEPLSREELQQLGVFWLDEGNGTPGIQVPPRGAGPVNVLLTRLHVRYDGDHFPEDLVFQETSDRTNFQARYVLQHAWKGDATCSETGPYRTALHERHGREAQALSELTGWKLGEIRTRMGEDGRDSVETPWYKKIWKSP